MFESLEIGQLETEKVQWTMGPYHAALPGAMKIHFLMDGDLVWDARIEAGFLHKGLEKIAESRSWEANIVLADHVDPESAIFGELALCLAAEKIFRSQVPPRAQAVRILVCELSRVVVHISYLIRMATVTESETAVHYLSRDRERLLDLFELLSGSRFAPNFLRFGGIESDVTEGFLERVIEISEMIRHRLKEYNDLFSFNRALMRRTTGVGVLDLETLTCFGISGPNARASGLGWDVRKMRPYSGYEDVNFVVPVGTGEFGRRGDSYDRILVRLRELSESLALAKNLSETLPRGDFIDSEVTKKVVPPGEAYAVVESPRGTLGCYLVSDGGQTPVRVQYRAPSINHLRCLPVVLRGLQLEDVPVVISSLDISVAEVDR